MKYYPRDRGRERDLPGSATACSGPFGILAAAHVICLAALLLSKPADAEPQDQYQGYRTEAFLRFLDAPKPGRGIEKVPRLRLSFGGGAARAAVLDTGSTGVVVSADALTAIDKLPSQGPAALTYSSSGRIVQGIWVVTSVTVAGSDGTSITTLPIPIIAVTRISCTPTARSCTPEDHPKHVAMIGIGFAREYDHQAEGTPDKNPLLNVAAVGGTTMRRGYVVSRDGVHVGLTANNTDGAFAFVKLDRNQDLPDWAPAPACVIIGQTAPACGKVLVDTGVSGMFLTVPPDRLPSTGANDMRRLGRGSTVEIRLMPLSDSPSASYGFRVGETANPMAPSSVTLAGIGRRPTFVNTSFHFMNGFDYLFDADGGWVGYRPVK